MRTITIGIALLASLVVPACFGQLTPEQKEQDFDVLAGLYAKNYAPYEWKKQAFGFDLLRTAPWLERVRSSKSDLEFYEICIEYVSSLQDSHVWFGVPSDFRATLNIGLDIYDGKVLIEAINRTRLPLARFPFVIGDEVVSVDGVAVEAVIENLSKFVRQANPRSTRRFAAAYIASRSQAVIPRAPELGESATVVVRRANGAEETYTLPWTKTGTPLTVGPVPSPKRTAVRGASRIDDADPVPDQEAAPPAYERAWRKVQQSGVSDSRGLVGYGARNPIYALPAGFLLRQGASAADFFVSGTYQSAGQRIGYIRIPNYGTLSPAVLTTFEREIAFFQQNTDGLVVDQMRNTGGYLCFGENVVARLTPNEFRPIGYQIRATRAWLLDFYNDLQSARAGGADTWIIDLYESLFQQVNQAYSDNRGLTGPVPLCSPGMTRQPAKDSAGRSIAYTKPLLMLIDEFSTSTADSVPAMLQDAGRGILFGMRTNGAGGTNTSFYTGAYSEGLAGMTLGIMTRKEPIATPEYPTGPYIENIGVRPDIEYDYMTRDNLLQQGRPFVAAFTEAIVNAIRTGGK
jgi:hypothetical protein